MRKYLIAILCCICMTTTGCNFLGSLDLMNDGSDGETQPDTEIEYTEQQHWDAIASYVEGEKLNSTDEVLVVVQWMKDLGYLSDTGRVDVFRDAREPINASNKNHVANTLTGGG